MRLKFSVCNEMTIIQDLLPQESSNKECAKHIQNQQRNKIEFLFIPPYNEWAWGHEKVVKGDKVHRIIQTEKLQALDI